MDAPSLPRTFHAGPSSIGTWIGGLLVVSGGAFGLGVVWDSGRLMARAGGGLVIGLVFLVVWLVRRVRSVTVEAGAVTLDARRFPVAGARVTSLESRMLGGQIVRSFWMALPSGSDGEVKRGFTSAVWPEIGELHAAIRAAGVEDGMPYPR
jgi:hypothetical protein